MASNVLTNLKTVGIINTKVFPVVAENYIYMYHLDKYIILPGYADSVNDTIGVTYASSNPISRSAPIYSYQNSGPRQIQVAFNLHRDEMTQLNTGNPSLSNRTLDSVNNFTLVPTESGMYRKALSELDNDDYVDFMIRAVQAMALPEYASSQKMVNPPLVAVRLGQDIFIKGVISGSVSLTYKYPILANGKYSNVDIAFSVAEVDPYDASTVLQTGSYRGDTLSVNKLNTTLERNIWSYEGVA